jgi:hypothetical protein
MRRGCWISEERQQRATVSNGLIPDLAGVWLLIGLQTRLGQGWQKRWQGHMRHQ